MLCFAGREPNCRCTECSQRFLRSQFSAPAWGRNGSRIREPLRDPNIRWNHYVYCPKVRFNMQRLRARKSRRPEAESPYIPMAEARDFTEILYCTAINCAWFQRRSFCNSSAAPGPRATKMRTPPPAHPGPLRSSRISGLTVSSSTLIGALVVFGLRKLVQSPLSVEEVAQGE
jgi:hypothetical protein